MQGSWCAGRGAGQAFRASMASQLPTMKSLASWLPEIIIGITFCKPLQVQLTLNTCSAILLTVADTLTGLDTTKMAKERRTSLHQISAQSRIGTHLGADLLLLGL